MTISDQTARVQITTFSGILNYLFIFPIHDESDVLVVMKSSAGDETVFNDPADYSVSMNGSPPGSTGGNVNLVLNPGTGQTISIILDPDRVQLTTLPITGRVDTAAIETTLDKFLNMIKRANDLGIRGLRLSEGSVFDAMFPDLGRWDALASRMTNLGAPEDANDAATLAYVQSQIAAAILDPSVTVSTQGADLIDETSFDDMLALLGGLATGIALFKDATTGDAMDTLTFSAYFQTLVTAVDAAALQALGVGTVGSSLDNEIVNGDAQVWQHGETFLLPADASYIADQFIFLEETANSVDVSRVTSTFPEHAKGGIFIEQQVGKDNEKWALLQIIESRKVIPMQGHKISCSIDVLASGNLTKMEMHLIFWDGDADDPVIDPISTWGAAETAPTLVANWDFVSGGQFQLTAYGSWNTFKIEDVTLSGVAVNLGILLVTDDGLFTGGAVVRTTNWNLVPGSVIPQFTSKSFTDTLRDCQRFFFSTFLDNTLPADNLGFDGSIKAYPVEEGANKRMIHYFYFPSHMIKSPAVAPFNPSTGTATWWHQTSSSGTAPPSIPAASIDAGGVSIASASGSMSNLENAIHMTADARFDA